MDYDALEKRLRDLGMYSAELAADAIADLRARNEALVEAVKKARPIVEDDHDQAKEHGDSDWEGLSYETLEAIDNALAANREK